MPVSKSVSVPMLCFVLFPSFFLCLCLYLRLFDTGFPASMSIFVFFYFIFYFVPVPVPLLVFVYLCWRLCLCLFLSLSDYVCLCPSFLLSVSVTAIICTKRIYFRCSTFIVFNLTNRYRRVQRKHRQLLCKCSVPQHSWFIQLQL